MPHTFDPELKIIEKKLDGSSVDLAMSLKLKTAEAVLRLMTRKDEFGMFVILGWQSKWNDYLDISDSAQDIFATDHHGIAEDETFHGHDIGATVDFDGAILIDRRGTLIHSGVMIEGMRPRAIADKINPGKFTDLSEQLGFSGKVHTRHLTAIAASYVFKGTTVYTVSEESGSMHIYEGGRIVHEAKAKK